MAIDDVVDEVKIVDMDEGSMIVKHRGEFALVSLDEAATECESISGETYSEKLKKAIRYNTAVSIESGTPEAYIGPILAHEIGEAIMLRKGYEQSKAHRYGKKCESIYAQLFMNDEEAAAFFAWLKEKRADARRENGILFDDY